jgi:PAS domain S-box-containing protein
MNQSSKDQSRLNAPSNGESVQAFLLRLVDSLRLLVDPVVVQHTAMQFVIERFAATRAIFLEVNPEGDTVTAVEGVGRSPLKVPHARFPVTDYGAFVRQSLSAGETVAIEDVETDARLNEAERTMYRKLGIAATAAAPLIEDGHLAAAIVLHQETQRAWTTDELWLLQDVAERTCDAIDRARQSAELVQSERHYRTLFDSIDEGFCTIEVLFDETRAAVDYRFLSANVAFERQTGLTNVLGRTIRELVPDNEPFWPETFATVVATGQPVHFEHSAAALDRTFYVYAFRLGEQDDHRVAVLFTDVGERNRVEETLRASQERLRIAMEAAEFYSWEVDFATRAVSYSTNVTRMAGIWPRSEDEALESVHPEDRETALQAYATAAENNDQIDYEIRTMAEDGEYGWYHLAGKLIRDSQGAAAGAIGTSRLVTAQHRVEDALRRSEASFRLLFETMNEGFCLYEIIRDESGAPVDVLVHEANAAYERLTERPNPVGRLLRSIDPDVDDEWLQSMADVVDRGGDARFIRYSPRTGRWFDVRANARIESDPPLLSLVFTDITEQHTIAQALGEREARQTYFLSLSDILRGSGNTLDAQSAVLKELGDFLGVDRTFYSEIDDVNAVFRTTRAYQPRGDSILGEFRLSDIPGVARMSQTGQPLVIEDTAGDERLTETDFKTLSEMGVAATIGVPLIESGRWAATLGVHQLQPRMWTADDVLLVQETAERLWIALERANAEQALRESEERFRAIAEEAVDYAIFTTDADRRITTWLPGAEVVFGWTAEEAIGMLMDETFTPEDRLDGAAEREFEGARTRGYAPDVRWHMRKDGSRVFIEGSVYARTGPDGTFLGAFKIGQDVTKRRTVEDALRENEERQALLLDLSDRKRAISDPAGIMAIATQQLARHLGIALAQFLLVGDDGDMYEVGATYSDGRLPDSPLTNGRLSDYGRDWAERLAAGQSIWEEEPRADVTPRRAFGLVSASAVPLLRNGVLLAVLLTADIVPRTWSRAVQSLQREIAERTWASVERARAEEAVRMSEASLQQRVAEATAELRTLSRRLLDVQEEERRRLALELHDEIGQSLTALSLQLAGTHRPAEELIENARGMLTTLTEQVQRLSMELRPAVLDHFGIIESVRSLCSTFEQGTGVRLDLDVSGHDDRIPDNYKIAIYRVVQEALTNVARHSGVAAATVQLTFTENQVTANVSDSGQGFDPQRSRLSTGLGGMRERIEILGGSFMIDSAPGRGTSVRATLAY